MLVSGVQQSDLVIHVYMCVYLYPFFPRFFSVIVYHMLLNIVPCAISKSLLFIMKSIF